MVPAGAEAHAANIQYLTKALAQSATEGFENQNLTISCLLISGRCGVRVPQSIL
jgi:hypothetical protein